MLRRLALTLALIGFGAFACGSDSGGSSKDTLEGQDSSLDGSGDAVVPEVQDGLDVLEQDTLLGEDGVAQEDSPGLDTLAPPEPGTWGESAWEAWWPLPEEDEASYHGSSLGGEAKDWPVKLEFGVDLDGETWNRLTVGTAEPGQEGEVFYFDHSEPYKITVKRVITFMPGNTEDPVAIETMDPPGVFDFKVPEGQDYTEVQTTLKMSFPGPGTTNDVPMIYRVAVEEENETVTTTALGELQGCTRIAIYVCNPDYAEGLDNCGKNLFWIHPVHFVVKVQDFMGWTTGELALDWN